MAKQKPVKKSQPVKSTAKKSAIPAFWSDPQLVWPVVAILVITVICFIPTFSNQFVNWDDDVNILDNKNLRAFDWENIKGIFTHNIMGGYNPLPIFTFAVEKAIWGLNPLPYHVNNLILHLICVFFVYRVALGLNLSRNGAFILALLFGIHPMRVESVAWVTERKDVMFGVFYFAAMFTYIRSIQLPQKKTFYIILTLFLFLISLFSKIQAVALPLSLLAVDYYLKRPLNFKLVIEKIPFFILSLVVGSIGIILLKQEKTLLDITQFGFFNRLLIGAYTYCVYIGKFIYPWIMSCLYPYPAAMHWGHYLAPLGVAAAVAWFIFAFKQKQYHVAFGLAFFSLNVVFVLQILGAGQGYLADRFTYIPYFGLFFLLASGYEHFVAENASSKTMVNVILGVYFLVFGYMTWNQTATWQNGETLWTQALKFEKKTALPFGNRAQYYRSKKMYDKALADYTEGIRLSPKANLYNSLGKMYFDSGNAADAIKNYSMGISKDSTIGEIWVNRGAAYGMLGNLPLALADLNKGLAMDTTNLNAYLNRSLVLEQMGRTDLALLDHQKYLSRNPYNDQIWYESGRAKRILGRDQESIPDFDKAISLKPAGLYYLERSRAYYKLGNKSMAVQDAQAAISYGEKIDDTYRKLLGI